jgi:hypothetical protein
VNTKQSIQIEDKGEGLKSGLIYHWKIRVWDEDGYVSNWSNPATFEMGLLANDHVGIFEFAGAFANWKPLKVHG